MTNLLELSKIMVTINPIVLAIFDKNMGLITKNEFTHCSTFNSYLNRESLQKYHEDLTIISVTFSTNGSVIIGAKES